MSRSVIHQNQIIRLEYSLDKWDGGLGGKSSWGRDSATPLLSKTALNLKSTFKSRRHPKLILLEFEKNHLLQTMIWWWRNTRSYGQDSNRNVTSCRSSLKKIEFFFWGFWLTTWRVLRCSTYLLFGRRDKIKIRSDRKFKNTSHRVRHQSKSSDSHDKAVNDEKSDIFPV